MAILVKATALSNSRLSLTVAVTVRVFHPLPYYPEHLFKHLKTMQRTCKEARKLARSYRAVNFGFQENFTFKFHFKSRQGTKKHLLCLEKRHLVYFKCSEIGRPLAVIDRSCGIALQVTFRHPLAKKEDNSS